MLVPSLVSLAFLLFCLGMRERRTDVDERGPTKLLLIRCPVLSAARRHQEHHPQRHDVGILEGREKKHGERPKNISY